MTCNFQPPESFCLTGSTARMHGHEGMHLLKQARCTFWKRLHTALPDGGPSIPIVPANRALWELRLSPRHARQPLQDATIYLYDRYGYL